VFYTPSLSINHMPPRTTRKSYRPRVSDRTMVGTAQPLCLFASGTEGRRHHRAMNLRRRQNHTASLHYPGWTTRPSPLRLPVAGELFLLTSPFIERRYRRCGVLDRYLSGLPPYQGVGRNTLWLICGIKVTLCWANRYTRYVHLHACRNN
jgi:hypothetical protein